VERVISSDIAMFWEYFPDLFPKNHTTVNG